MIELLPHPNTLIFKFTLSGVNKQEMPTIVTDLIPVPSQLTIHQKENLARYQKSVWNWKRKQYLQI